METRPIPSTWSVTSPNNFSFLSERNLCIVPPMHPFLLRGSLVCLVLLFAACTGEQNSTDVTTTLPSDFALEYFWAEGSVPPPYHNEYEITIDEGGAGSIVYRADYEPTDQEWTESFTVSEAARQELYAAMVEADLFTRSLAEDDDPPIGGSATELNVTADGELTEVPAFPQDSSGLEELYESIEALVPEALWTTFEAQRQEFIDSYEDE